MMLSTLLVAFMGFFSIYSCHTEAQWKISEKVTYLSYIPPIDIYGKSEPLYQISLQKLNVFNEETLDDFAKLEQLTPIIDKVLYIPDGFHEYASLNRQGVERVNV